GPRRLINRHACSREHPASSTASLGQKLCLKRKIDHVGNPVPRLQKLCSDRHAGKLCHADRGCVDNAVGSASLGRRVTARSYLCPKQCAQIGCQCFCSLRNDIDNNEPLNPAFQQGVSDGGS